MTAGRPLADRGLDALIKLRTLLWWGLGGALTGWRYLARRPALVRRHRTVMGEDPGPADRPVPGNQGPLQRRADGSGASLRRLYRVVIDAPRLPPEEVIDRVAADPNAVSPFEVARFVKTAGRLGEMTAGDEYLVWMAGPWNGPVRVAERGPRHFRLATLSGHMEAGEIEFRARREGERLAFEIESAARSGSRPFWLVYGPLRVAREAQLHMWATFCERVAAMAGRPASAIEVRDERFPDDHGTRAGLRALRARRTLASLAGRPVNFPHRSLDHVTEAEGWAIDHHVVPLAEEPPGPPVPGGPFERARELVRGYQFADPGLVRAIYDPAEPLERRNMLLEGRFLGMRFRMGVRVVAVVDDTTERDGQPVRRWGWSYRTLRGHLEMGQMDFEVAKDLRGGEVEFRIRAVSRPAPVRNPVVRAGFRIFGRRLQLRFARVAGQRMRDLVAGGHAVGTAAGEVPPAAVARAAAPPGPDDRQMEER